MVLLTYESRVDVEPIAGLEVELRTLGPEVPGNVDVPFVSIGGWR